MFYESCHLFYLLFVVVCVFKNLLLGKEVHFKTIHHFSKSLLCINT